MMKQESFKLNIFDFVADENGRFQFKLDGDFVGAFNLAVRNIAEEAKDIATSWTYNRYADSWELDYRYKRVEGFNVIKKVILKNTDTSAGSQGLPGAGIWTIMNEGRRGGYPIEPHHTKYLKLFHNRFRTDKYRAAGARGGQAQQIEPLEQAYEAMESSMRELVDQLAQDSVNFGRVRALGNTVFTNTFTPRAPHPDAQYGDYGGEWRQDIDYPLLGNFRVPRHSMRGY